MKTCVEVSKQKSDEKEALAAAPGANKRIALNRQFYEQLKGLIKIVLPGVKSKEFFLLALHIGFLIVRTFLSIYIATLDGEMVKSIVDRNGKVRQQRCQHALAERTSGISVEYRQVDRCGLPCYLRERHDPLFGIQVVHCLPNTSREPRVCSLHDQRDVLPHWKFGLSHQQRRSVSHRGDSLILFFSFITISSSSSSIFDSCDDVSDTEQDVSRFCSSLAHLHSQLSKPILDVILMTWQLARIASKKSEGGGLVTSSLSEYSSLLFSFFSLFSFSLLSSLSLFSFIFFLSSLSLFSSFSVFNQDFQLWE